jgi:hypothetical protein
LAFTTATGYLGFQVTSLVTGKPLSTVPITEPAHGCSYNGQNPCAPSHSISLAPNEREVYKEPG